MKELVEMIRKFDTERDWGQFHSPKNLAIGLSVEAAELLEIFQWISEKESFHLTENKQTQLAEEIGDIMIYLANLSDKFGINPIVAAKDKLKLNETKYPSDMTKGSAKKYSEYQILNDKGDPHTTVQALLTYRTQQKTGGPLARNNKDADKFLRGNLYAFLMAALMQRGSRAEAVWEIPFHLFNKLDHLDPLAFSKMTSEQLEEILRSLPQKPRYPNQAAKTIISLSKIVVNQFGGNVCSIWEGRKPADVAGTLVGLSGVGPGIANMTIRILLDVFGYDPGPEGRKQINVKADTHVIRVFYRTGLIQSKSADECIQAARQLYPEFPGLLDWPAWEIGRTWCHEHNPECVNCPLPEVCSRLISENI